MCAGSLYRQTITIFRLNIFTIFIDLFVSFICAPPTYDADVMFVHLFCNNNNSRALSVGRPEVLSVICFTSNYF